MHMSIRQMRFEDDERVPALRFQAVRAHRAPPICRSGFTPRSQWPKHVARRARHLNEPSTTPPRSSRFDNRRIKMLNNQFLERREEQITHEGFPHRFIELFQFHIAAFQNFIVQRFQVFLA